jgi:hypothetical protein
MSKRKYEEVKIPEWDGSELCAQIPHELFYDQSTRSVADRADINNLRRVCDNCPRLLECREYAIKHELYGFWGGMTEKDRMDFRKKYKIKYIRPELYSEMLPDFREAQ